MPAIYVASLTDYNHGTLHGVRIELDETSDVDDVTSQVDAMLAESPTVKTGLSDLAEEYAIHDYEGFGGHAVPEYTPLAQAVQLAAAIDQRGAPFARFLNDRHDESLDDSITNYEDRLIGTWDTADAYAWENFEELHPDAYALVTSSEWVTFDPDAYVRSDEMDGYEFIETSDGVTVLTPDR